MTVIRFGARILPTGRYSIRVRAMTQLRGQETHSRLLRAAAEAFAREGYDAASVAEICQGAGVSKGAFYHHFESKQSLFMELLDKWLDGLTVQLSQARTDANNVPDALLGMAAATGWLFDEPTDQFVIFLEFLTQAIRDPAVWKATVAPYRSFADFFRRLVQAGIAEGTIRPVDAERAAQVIVSLAVGLLVQSMLDPDHADWASVTQDSMKMLLQGLELVCRDES